MASVSLGTGKKKKKKTTPTDRYGPTNSVKILSDGNWVMMPNGCEKLSDE